MPNHEIIYEDDRLLELWDGKTYHDIHILLYNVEVANELGQKLYKKAEIRVEDSFYWIEEDLLDGYVVTEIELR